MLRTAVQVYDVVGEWSGLADAVAVLPLQPDDLRAEQSEQPSAVGDGAAARQLGHPHAGERRAWRLLPGDRHRKLPMGFRPVPSLELCRSGPMLARHGCDRGDSTVTPSGDSTVTPSGESAGSPLYGGRRRGR